MVRIGIGLYGVYPSPETAQQINLTPVVALVSQIVEIQDLSEGDRIGYGGTYRVPAGERRRVAVVAAGYHDCVPRCLSNFGYVSVDGRKCRILGRVSMDSMVVDVSDCPGAAVGSDVLIYGRHGGSSVSIEEVAAASGASATLGLGDIFIATTSVNPGTAVGRVITGLNPGTTYYFGIITQDDSLNWSTFTVRTSCETIRTWPW